ncbi:hypothetical protein ACHAP5_007542 [Fusarium lateritium]
MSIAAFLLLKLIILISTTLFVVRDTTTTRAFDISIDDSFGTAKAWSLYDDVREDGSPSTWVSRSENKTWLYLARLNNVTSVGTNWKPKDGIVTQRFGVEFPQTGPTTLDTTVEIFVPKVECEEAILSAEVKAPPKRPQDTEEGKYTEVYLNVTLNSDICSNITFNDKMPCESVRHGDVKVEYPDTYTGPWCQRKQHFYEVYSFSCSPSDERWAFITAECNTKFEDPKNLTSSFESMNLVRSASTICKIEYGVTKANVTLDLSTSILTLRNDINEEDAQPMTNLSSKAFTRMLLMNLEMSKDSFNVDDNVPTRQWSEGWEPSTMADPLFQLIYTQMGYPPTLDPFYEANTLMNATTLVLKGFSQEVARYSLLVPDLKRGLADGTVTEKRLHVRDATIWVMIAAFCVLSLSCLLVAYKTQPFAWVPAMSGSIAGHTSLLANSPYLKSLLAGTGHLTEQALKGRLESIHFTGDMDPTGQVKLQAEGHTTPISPRPPVMDHSNRPKKSSPWIPLAVRRPILFATFVGPVIAITVLEILYRLLKNQKILIETGSEDSTASSYIVRIASALVVFLLTTMVNNLDFTILTFAPYSSLRGGSVPADRSILFHPLSISPFLILIKSLRHGQYGTATSNAASLIAGFLTVIVSGLWISTDSMANVQPSVASVDNWSFAWLTNSTTDGGAAQMLNNVRHGGAVTPRTSWKDLVIPRISTSSPDAVKSGNTSNHSYDVMALQPVLNCTVVPQESINVSLSITTAPGDWVHGSLITVTPPDLPKECAGASANKSSGLSFNMTVPEESPMWVGEFLDFPYTSGSNCPSIGILFGHVYNNNNTDSRELTALICNQGVKQVPITINYSGEPANGKIESVVVRNKSKDIEFGTGHERYLGFKAAERIDLAFTYFDSDDVLHEMYDYFFDHLTHRPGGHTREELTRAKNAQKLIQAVTQDFNEYMRHVIDLNFRANGHESEEDLVSAIDNDTSVLLSSVSNITGKSTEEITHIVIDGTSKLILQILLAAMTTMSLTGLVLIKIRGTLPRNPCSIGSTMAFLADSQLCDEKSNIIPPSAQLIQDKQLEEAFSGWVFSLGLWVTTNAAAEREVEGERHGGDEMEVEEGPTESHAHEDHDETMSPGEGNKWFGVDIGKANI